jgi:hypothetical protein
MDSIISYGVNQIDTNKYSIYMFLDKKLLGSARIDGDVIELLIT